MRVLSNCCNDLKKVVDWFEELKRSGSTYENILDQLDFDSDQYPNKRVLLEAREIVFGDQLKHMIKAGKLANGAERGKGRKVHLVNPYQGRALCGEEPAIQWIEREELAVNCEKCLKNSQKRRFII